MNEPQGIYSLGRFRKALGAFLLGRAAQALANFFLTLGLVRVLELPAYGAYMAVWGLVELMVPLSAFGLLEAVRRFLPQLAAQGSAVRLRAFVAWTTLARLAILGAWGLSLYLGWSSVANWVGMTEAQALQARPVALLIVLVLSMRFACEMLETLLEQRFSQSVQALMPIGRLMAAVGLVINGSMSLGHMILADIAVAALCFVAAEWSLVRRVSRTAGAGEAPVGVADVVRFAWHMFGVNLLGACASLGAMRLLAGRLFGLEALGVFAFLQQLINILARYMPAQLLANVVRPMLIARVTEGGEDRVGRVMGLMWKSNLMVVLAGCAFSLAAGDMIIAVMSGGRFADAGIVALMMLVGLGATSQGLLVTMNMQIRDRSAALQAQSILFLLPPVAAAVGARYGLLGFTCGIALGHWARNLVAFWWMRRKGVAFDNDLHGLCRMTLVAVTAGLGGWFAGQSIGGHGAAAVCGLLLLAGLFLSRPLNVEEFGLIETLVKGRARYLECLVKRPAG